MYSFDAFIFAFSDTLFFTLQYFLRLRRDVRSTRTHRRDASITSPAAQRKSACIQWVRRSNDVGGSYRPSLGYSLPTSARSFQFNFLLLVQSEFLSLRARLPLRIPPCIASQRRYFELFSLIVSVFSMLVSFYAVPCSFAFSTL